MRKKKPVKKDKVYIFRIILNQNHPYYQEQGIKEKVWRDIAILGEQNLYDFAESIVNAFDFGFDHCFGFFDDLKNWLHSNVRYELFADLPDEEKDPKSQSVKKNKVRQLFQKKGDKMLFLFDYGDNWEFIVELKEIKEPNPRKSYPYVVDRAGSAPKQYPQCEEE